MPRFALGATGLALGLSVLSAPQSPSIPPHAIDAAVDRGVAQLLAEYSDGDRRGAPLQDPRLALPERSGLRALTVYALLKSGVDARNPVVERLLAGLGGERFDRTYDAACMLLVLCTLDPSANREWIADLATDLLGWLAGSGEFGYPAGEGDLSNTQFGTVALRSAALAGFDVPADAWIGIARAVLRHQAREGGFTYTAESRRKPSGSMTVAGIGTLAICEERLAGSPALPADLEEGIRRGRANGLRWLARHFAVDRNPEYGSFTHYYLYGLERMGAFAGVERVGEHDWYREGAGFLLSSQLGDGSWAGTFRGEATPFALLFLRRASAPTQPRTGAFDDRFAAIRSPSLRGTSVEAPVRIGAAAGTPLLLWIRGLANPLNAALEWPGERGAGPRVLRVDYLGDGRPIAAALGDPERPAREGRFLCEDRSLAPGSHRVSARVLVRPPPGRDGVEAPARILESDEIEVEVGAWPAVPAARPETALRRLPNLLADAHPKAAASSVLVDSSNRNPAGFAAACAVDGNPRTPWVAAAVDESPELRIALAAPLRANRVRVACATLFPRTPGFITRPIAVTVRVNGGPGVEAPFRPGAGNTVEIRLETAVAVLSLELRLLGREVAGRSVGIGEVELGLAPE
jgi:hypothetical protein